MITHNAKVKMYSKTALRGIEIDYGVVESPYGRLLLGQTGEGLCWAGFLTLDSEDGAIERLKRCFPKAQLRRNDRAVKETGRRLLAQDVAVPLVLYGTPFQHAVWERLLDIPKGKTVTYGQVAREIGQPSASRAVGGAVGSNPVSIGVPCHRVLASDGSLGGYAWGTALKVRILQEEGLRVAA